MLRLIKEWKQENMLSVPLYGKRKRWQQHTRNSSFWQDRQMTDSLLLPSYYGIFFLQASKKTRRKRDKVAIIMRFNFIFIKSPWHTIFVSLIHSPELCSQCDGRAEFAGFAVVTDPQCIRCWVCTDYMRVEGDLWSPTNERRLVSTSMGIWLDLL